MAVNLNAAAFTLDMTQTSYAHKAVAEAYMQMYQYAAEDFITHPDFYKFYVSMLKWMGSVDARLSQQMALISSHSHTIPPHGHGAQGAQPVPLTTMPPSSQAAIVWSPVEYPLIFNTTGTIPNMAGNMISISIASEGSAVPTIRRAMPIPLTMVPTLSPNITDSLTSAIL